MFSFFKIFLIEDLRQNNSELAVAINNLQIELEDLKEENQLSQTDIHQLHAEIKQLKKKISSVAMNESS